MANQEQLAILKQGVEVWNKWRAENPSVKISLSGSIFRESDLHEVYLSRADLLGADLIGADLRKANLSMSHLDLAGLIGANLKEANLVRADLSAADINGADLRRAIIGLTKLTDIDLSQVVGLNEVNHLFPSHISLDTLQQSQGRIPEVFLRGCGLGDWEIEMAKLYNPDLTNEERNRILYRVYDLQASQAIQVSPLFISYSHGDGEFVDKIGDCLTKKGIRYWRDIHDLKAGRIETQIDRAINENRIVLLVLSGNSLKSDWVQHEVRTARDEEKKSGRDVMCPVALDTTWNSKDNRWPRHVMEQIMEYNILVLGVLACGQATPRQLSLYVSATAEIAASPW